MTDKRKGIIIRRRIFTVIACLLLILISIFIGNIFYPEEVKMYGVFTIGDLLTMDTTGLVNTGYLSYVFICILCWVCTIVIFIWWIISEIKDNNCINHKNCFKCKKYLSCKRKVRLERNY